MPHGNMNTEVHITSQDEASYVESTLMQLYTVARHMNEARLEYNKAHGPTHWSGEILLHDPGMRGARMGLKWGDHLGEVWIPFVEVVPQTVKLFTSLAGIAAFIMHDGWETGDGLEEHYLMDIGDCAGLYDDGSVIESDPCTGGHNIYKQDEWYIHSRQDADTLRKAGA